MDPHNNSKLVDQDKLKYWGPVDVYIGGDEHNTLHLLYSRFIYQFLYDLGCFPSDLPEPYYKRISHGVILGPDSARMSKSKGNVIVPETVADKYGVDVIRMYLMFIGPFEGTMAWNENTLMGVKRFLDRFEKAVNSWQLRVVVDSSTDVKVIMNKLVSGVTKDLEGFGYNTAIAKMMEALNKLQSTNFNLQTEDIKTLIMLLAPMAPYLAEELWNQVRLENDPESVHLTKWPETDKKYLVEEKITLMVAVNGKTRGQLLVSSDQLTDKSKITEMAKNDPKVKTWIEGKKIIREIYVEGKMVNLVISG
jgi:leucyl-tRNA synthetase